MGIKLSEQNRALETFFLHLFKSLGKIFAYGIGHLLFIGAVKTEFERRALRSGKRHDSDNGFTVDLKAIFINIKIGSELAGKLDDRRSGAGMQSCSVEYGNGSCDQSCAKRCGIKILFRANIR